MKLSRSGGRSNDASDMNPLKKLRCRKDPKNGNRVEAKGKSIQESQLPTP